MKQLITSSLLLALSCFANAEFIDTDIDDNGNYRAVIDSSTGTQWLKLTNTNQFTFNEIFTRLEQSGDLFGYRYALESEVYSLMLNIAPNLTSLSNIPFTGSTLSGNNDVDDNFYAAFGSAGSPTSRVYAYGNHFIEKNGATVAAVTGITTLTGDSNFTFYANHDATYLQNMDFKHQVHGHWLVFDESIIENSQINTSSDVSSPLLGALGASLFLFGAFTRKKSNPKED